MTIHPQFAIYASTLGVKPEDVPLTQAANAAYINWSTEQWRQFRAEHREVVREGDRRKMFLAWLRERHGVAEAA